MYQVLRTARTTAIVKASEIPNIGSLPARRTVTFTYRDFGITLKTSCLEEHVSLAFACAVKGIAVESGQLMPIFAEDSINNHACVCAHAMGCMIH